MINMHALLISNHKVRICQIANKFLSNQYFTVAIVTNVFSLFNDLGNIFKNKF